MRLAEKIPRLAKRAGLSQAELARAIGVHPARISEWAHHRGRPGLDQAFRMARALDVPLDYLADDDQDEPPAATAGLAPDEMAVLVAYRVQRAHESISPEEAAARLRFPAEPPRRLGYSNLPDGPTNQAQGRDRSGTGRG